MATVTPSDAYLTQVGQLSQNYMDIKQKFDTKLTQISNVINKDPEYQYGVNENNKLREVILSDNRVNKLNYNINSPSISDGMQSDINIMLLQENMMYIIDLQVMMLLIKHHNTCLW